VLILAGFIFLAFVAASAKILFYQPIKEQFKNTPVGDDSGKEDAREKSDSHDADNEESDPARQ
ncbi:MAG: hypothetical protein K2H72_09430, partial [Muribaculaceae bacterium]|nr:hypothetical protein [Muribaculaceae bacterium]